MHALDAIAKGLCPMCFGERVVWNAMSAESHWCTCCGGTGVYPPPANSTGDGLYDVHDVVAELVKPQTRRRVSRYAVPANTSGEPKTRVKADKPDGKSDDDGDWPSIISSVISELGLR